MRFSKRGNTSTNPPFVKLPVGAMLRFRFVSDGPDRVYHQKGGINATRYDDGEQPRHWGTDHMYEWYRVAIDGGLNGDASKLPDDGICIIQVSPNLSSKLAELGDIRDTDWIEIEKIKSGNFQTYIVRRYNPARKTDSDDVPF